MIQCSGYYLTPFGTALLKTLGYLAEVNGGTPIPSRFPKEQPTTVYVKDTSGTTTTMVVIQVSLLLSLVLWAAASFGVGITVEMKAVEMGWYVREGGMKGEDLKEECD